MSLKAPHYQNMKHQQDLYVMEGCSSKSIRADEFNRSTQNLPTAFCKQRTVHEFHANHHSITFYFIKKDSKRCCDTTTPESIHTKDES